MTTPRTNAPTAVPWPAVLLVAAFALAIGLGRLNPLPWPGLDDPAARIIGYGLGAVGVSLMAWGFLTLQRAGTTVLPHKRVDKLVTDGAFRFRRNPIYMGETLVILALAQPTHNIWFVLLAPLFAIGVYWLAILPEERHLEERFGAAYVEYKERTRRWF
jgi:protein-S-isoprenylcysteine O-methyltransferase Ste14